MAKPLPPEAVAMKGKSYRFMGNVLSSSRTDDFVSEILDIRWGSATMININDKNEPRKSSLEYLIRRPGKLAHWSKPFPYTPKSPIASDPGSEVSHIHHL